MKSSGFREKRSIGESSESKSILSKQLEIAHKRDREFGKYIMLVKGWAVTLFLIIIFESGDIQLNFFVILFSVLSFIFLWTIEGLMAAYQDPYYKAIRQIEDELAKKEDQRKYVPLTYVKGKERQIVFSNFRKCILRPSLSLFYGFLIFCVVIYLSFGTAVKTSVNTMIFQVWAIAASFLTVFVYIVIACFMWKQVKAQEVANKKSVVPVLGITLRRDKERNLTDTLMIYVRNNIALDVRCELYKNGHPVPEIPDKWPSAIPALRTDILLPMWERSFKKDISDSNKDKKVNFKAIFTYRSILKDEYKSEYYLSAWMEDNLIKKEEKLELELPWDC